MNIGHLKNEALISAYKALGFSTRNQLIDAALELLKATLIKKKRSDWRKAAHKDYAKAKVDFSWESIDGDDFEST